MSTKLGRILDEIEKTERRIAELQEHLKELNMRREQLEDAEIVKSIRILKLDSRKLLEVLDGIRDGSVSLQHIEENVKKMEADGKRADKMPGGNEMQVPGNPAPEREDKDGSK